MFFGRLRKPRRRYLLEPQLGHTGLLFGTFAPHRPQVQLSGRPGGPSILKLPFNMQISIFVVVRVALMGTPRRVCRFALHFHNAALSEHCSARTSSRNLSGIIRERR
jgi:hypothetical protein